VIRGLKVLGLTGGIGTGKSTVAQMFADRGVPVVDADALAREVVAHGLPAHADIAAAWPDVVGLDGALDRKRLGAIVFGDPAARLRLEGITHPRIQALAGQRLAALAEAGYRLALYSAALLVESGRWREFDGLIVVAASEATQIARVRARDGLSQADAEARVRAQLATAEKIRLANYIIDNDDGLNATRAAVEDLLRRLRSDQPPD
jgi:dephospho-CoA kinase